jgi:hypothetical protein
MSFIYPEQPRDAARPSCSSRSHQKTGKYAATFVCLTFLCLALAACSNPFGGGNTNTGGPTPTATSATHPLASLHWCGKPSMVFRDEGAPVTSTATVTSTGTPVATATASGTPTATTTTAGAGTPTTITSWDVVKANLGFTVYLPATLPNDTCLVSAQATIHDPTFGGSFLIGYLLPDHTSLTISEAPLSSQNTTFQCNVSNNSVAQKSTGQPGTTGIAQAAASPAASPTTLPLQLCSGAQGTTNVVLSARRSVEYLQQFFSSLQPDITWLPTT